MLPVTTDLLLWPDIGEALSWGGGASGRLGHGHGSGIFGFQKSNRFFYVVKNATMLRTWVFCFLFSEVWIGILFFSPTQLSLSDGFLVCSTRENVSFGIIDIDNV